ncbi:olfactory receptor 6N2-like [Phyllobates terribilis]|uniref:olfactory receptor 6N2-like n=1 Tax=Phyllobates terribilis TaxID=111132 RepID=UPI003CCA963E
MCTENHTMVSEFFLLGFQSLHNLRILVFTSILLAYIFILLGNLLIVILVSIDHQLQVPMFYFLKHLALVDLLFTTNIVPNMLHVILLAGGTITTTGCFIQYCIHSLAVYTQSLILAVMSLDRYMAICQPLRYSSVMTPKLCLHLAFWSWAAGLFLSPSEFLLIFQLKFCSSNMIDHFFCDMAPFLILASSNKELIEWHDFAISFTLIFLPFLFIVLSYACIFTTILQISTSSGRRKAFSTCSTHLATVSTHCGILVTVYVFTTKGESVLVNKLRALLYTVLTPFINPLLYSIRNQEFRKAINKLIHIVMKASSSYDVPLIRLSSCHVYPNLMSLSPEKEVSSKDQISGFGYPDGQAVQETKAASKSHIAEKPVKGT